MLFYFKIISFSLIFLFFSLSSNAQINSDFDLIKKHLALEKTSQKKIKFQKVINPIKAISFLSLFLYQKIISEQISAVCEFDMSCSNFGVGSIKEFGILKAISLTVDRLTRCNGQAQCETENYLINNVTGKVIDEPSMYHFKN